eukprot:3808012-Alexandrium_andersonii.AAC.1
MSASLVGSEMCIRDSARSVEGQTASVSQRLKCTSRRADSTANIGQPLRGTTAKGEHRSKRL